LTRRCLTPRQFLARTKAATRSRPALDAIEFVLYFAALVSPLALTYGLLQWVLP
jgi:hypothetical protein